MRALVPLLLSTAACGQLFGLDAPSRLPSDGALPDDQPTLDAPTDAASDMRLTDAMWSTVVFRDADVRDTNLDSGTPTTPQDTNTLLRWRLNDRFALVAVDSIFSTIPPGAQIISAMLQLDLNSTNCTSSLQEVAVTWTTGVTYNTFGSAAGVDASDLGPVIVASIPTNTPTLIMDVTASVAAWSVAPSMNRGWMFNPTGGGGDCTAHSVDDTQTAKRPFLTVTYAAD
jgi:hypothetical protein